MVVAILLLVVVSLARPAFNAYVENLRHKGAVTAVKRTLQAARAKALSNPAVHCGVHFDLAGDTLRLIPFLDTHLPGNHAYEPGMDGAYLAPFDLPRGVSLEVPDPNPLAVVFRGDGSAHMSARAIVRSARGVDTVDVLASTGRIRVARW